MIKWRSSYGVTVSERGGLSSKGTIVIVRAFGFDSFLHALSPSMKTFQNGENFSSPLMRRKFCGRGDKLSQGSKLKAAKEPRRSAYYNT